MNGYALTAAIFDAIFRLAWPAAVLGCVWILRDEIRTLLPRAYVKHGDFEMGFTAGQQSAAQQALTAAEDTLPLKPATADLSTVSNKELQSLVEETTMKMRQMERDFKIERNKALYRSRHLDDWDDYTRELAEQSARQAYRWHTELRPDAIALRDALIHRLGKDHGVDMSDARVALDHGMLAGVSPLNEAATALEALARKLPD